MSKYYVNDVGTKMRVDAVTNISTATVLKLKIKKPDNTKVEWIATLEGLTFLTYIVQAGDWDQAGRYSLQSYIEMPGWTGEGDTTSFEIHDAFK